jgi:hypothetical protein
MRKRTAKRKVRRAKTRRGGAGENMKEEKNNSSYNASSRMYGGPIPIENEPNVSSRMYGGPAPIVNNVRVNRNNAVPVVNDRARQEEARELAEIHAELAEVVTRQLEHSELSDVEKRFVKQIQDAGEEVILYTGGHTYMERIAKPATGHPARFITLEYIITNRNIYSLRYNKQTTVIDFHGKVVSGLFVIPIYTFNEPLNLKQTKMLLLLLGHNRSYYSPPFPDGGAVKQLAFRNYTRGDEYKVLDARKKFESVIRLIPGSYQNSDWKQLDGFFGLYYNEKTMEFM